MKEIIPNQKYTEWLVGSIRRFCLERKGQEGCLLKATCSKLWLDERFHQVRTCSKAEKGLSKRYTAFGRIQRIR